MDLIKKTPFLFFVLLVSCSQNDGDNEVYICKGPSSKKYHLTPECKGLSNCSTKTYKVELSKARKMGRTLCGLED